MAHVSFTHDEPKPIDAALDEIAEQAAREGKALRVRLQPDIYDSEKGNYKAWAGLIWTIEVVDVDEGRRLREGLTDFFKAFGSDLKKQTKVLAAVKTVVGK